MFEKLFGRFRYVPSNYSMPEVDEVPDIEEVFERAEAPRWEWNLGSKKGET